MKIITKCILSLPIYFLSVSGSSDALAAERYKVFEFGEGGHSVSFPMTKKEIEKAQILRKRLKKIPEKPVGDDVEIYEMADGNIIVFEKSPSRMLQSQL